MACAVGVTLLGAPRLCEGQETGLIAHWTFDDPANLGKDSKGTNNGVAVGDAVSFISGRVGDGALMVQGGGHIQIPGGDSLRFAGTNNYTVSVWFYPEANSSWGGIIDKSRDQGSWWGIWRNPDLPRLFTGSAETWPPTEEFMADSVWHHAAIVQDGGAGTYKAYLDGVDLQVPFNSPLPDTGAGDILIGCANTGGGYENFRGVIDDARVYDRPLPETEIAQLYNTPASAPTLPLTLLGQPQDATLFAGDQAVLTAQANALDLGYQWFKGSSPVGDPGTAVLGAATFNTGPLSGGDSGATYHVVFTGATVGSVTSRVATVTVNTATGIDAGLVGRWTFDEPANLGKDIASTNDAVAAGGAYSFAAGRVGAGALAVNGMDGRLEVADSPALRFTAAQTFTLAAWVYPSTLRTAWVGVITKSRSQWPWYGIWLDNLSNWIFGGVNNLVGSALPMDDNGALVLGWHHVAIMQDGGAGTTSIYVDGVIAATGVAADANGVGPMWIGGSAGVTEFFDGLIDDVRLYKRVLSEAEIAQLFTAPVPTAHLPLAIVKQPEDARTIVGQSATLTVLANSAGLTAQWYKGSTAVGAPVPTAVIGGGASASFTTAPLTSADNGSTYSVVFMGSSGSITSRVARVTVKVPVDGLIARYTFDDPADLGADSAVGFNTGATIGGAAFSADSRIGGGALRVDGVNGHIEVAASPLMHFGAEQSCTLSAWFKTASPTGGWRGLVSKSRNALPCYGLWLNDGSYFVAGGDNITGPQITEGWHHVAVVQDGANATREMFVDGISAVAGVPNASDGGGPLWIGGAAGVSEFFNGWIDDVRIYNTALTSDQIRTLSDAPLPEIRVSLTVTRDADRIKITWPSSATGFNLESAVQLGAGAWQTVSQTPVLQGDQNRVEITIGGQNQFYRLKK